MTLPTDYANSTVSEDNHPDAHNTVNAAVNVLDAAVDALDARVVSLEESPPSGAVSGHASFTFNANTTAPPIGNQLRINNASQTLATTLWVADTSVDGLDVSVGLARVVAGSQIYIQDFDDASKWVMYSVTADAVDSGGYFTYAVVYHSGPADVPFQKIEFQPIAPGIVAVATYETVTFSQSGTLAAGTGTFRWYAKGAYTIVEVRASVGTAPTGAAVLVDVNKNGTTIFTGGTDRPNIAVSTNTDVGTPAVTTLADGDYLTVDIDQVGSTVAGSDLTVQIVLART